MISTFTLAAVDELKTLDSIATPCSVNRPEAALSPLRQLSLLTAINDLVNMDSQFIIATHSPIIMAYPNSWIYAFSATGITRMRYEETEHYRVTKAFLNRTAGMLNELLSDP
jgi:predicted ATPase